MVVQMVVQRFAAAIDLFRNNFPPSGEQPEHHKLAHDL